MTSGQLDLLSDYQRDLGGNAARTGQAAVDPHDFHTALKCILAAFADGSERSRDDITGLPQGSPAIGAAFAHLRREGIIRPTGWTYTARQVAHGRPLRTWELVP